MRTASPSEVHESEEQVPRYLVVVGASAGGVDALCSLVGELPVDLPAAVCVVLHLPDGGVSALPGILARCSKLATAQATEGQPLREGALYVAPPNFHFEIADSHCHLDPGPRQNSVRPSVDALFRSAAYAFGPRVVAVVLSGTLDDGTAGLLEVLRHGGIGVVQDPATAMFSGMPASAAQFVAPERVAPLHRLPGLIDDLVRRDLHDAVGFHSTAAIADPTTLGFRCPECDGTLTETVHAPQPHFECRVGHMFSPTTLLAAQARELERSLWAAVCALEERRQLLGRLAGRMAENGNASASSRYGRESASAKRHAERLRTAIAGLHTELDAEKV